MSSCYHLMMSWPLNRSLCSFTSVHFHTVCSQVQMTAEEVSSLNHSPPRSPKACLRHLQWKEEREKKITSLDRRIRNEMLKKKDQNPMNAVIKLGYFRADKTHLCPLFAVLFSSLREVYAKYRPTLLYVRYLLFPPKLSTLVKGRRFVDVDHSFDAGK